MRFQGFDDFDSKSALAELRSAAGEAPCGPLRGAIEISRPPRIKNGQLRRTVRLFGVPANAFSFVGIGRKRQAANEQPLAAAHGLSAFLLTI